MPIISVILGEGRTVQEKRDLCRALTEAATSTVGVKPEQVRVIINETPLDHYAVAGVTFAERAETAVKEASS
ncbi:4-oxalocrotonate tautomerase [Sphingobium xenophagum]|uniref:4-oxalocrotonate tautomerase n=1 Tax=Sphingobium xenophagum TaxID=121428 RepID=A0A249MSH8_SPHXE|nr:tautomerase family protein [Sphingobium xenophagum]ASY44135.1 4-oxalocrotonate tautomerase [Sphingobium xenophagum]